MSILVTPAPAVKPITLTIKNASYEATVIDPGFAGVAAVRLTKLVNPDCVYDVVLTLDGRVECDCPSYEMTYRGTSGTCKHGQALTRQGILVPPIAGGSPAVLEAPAPAPAPAAPVAEGGQPVPTPAFAPITRADLARARMFGLRLPDAPRAVEPAPAPKPAPAPAPAAGVSRPMRTLAPAADHLVDVNKMVPAPAAEAAPEIPAANPRDSWPAWTDEYRVALADEAAELPAPPPGDGPRPTRSQRFEPTAEEEAWWLGFCLGAEGEDAGPAAELGPELGWWFSVGRRAGWPLSPDGRAWIEDMEAMAAARDRAEREALAFGDPSDRVAEAERCGRC